MAAVGGAAAHEATRARDGAHASTSREETKAPRMLSAQEIVRAMTAATARACELAVLLR
jgi:hypothetical protein